METRSRLLVQALTAHKQFSELPSSNVRFRSRAQSLPAMLRKNGLLQTGLFLKAKGETDLKLWMWLCAGVKPLGLPQAQTLQQPEQIADLPLATYLLLSEACLECAVWIKRLVEATPEDPGESP